jgi:signal transduction histidine kinase
VCCEVGVGLPTANGTGHSSYVSGGDEFREDLSQNAQDAWATFDKAMEFLRRSTAEARRPINGQCITNLEKSGLKAAIEELISDVQARGGPPVRL